MIGTNEWPSNWGSEEFRRDFVFDLPETNVPILLVPTMEVTVDGQKLKLRPISGYSSIGQRQGQKRLFVETQIPKSYKRKGYSDFPACI